MRRMPIHASQVPDLRRVSVTLLGLVLGLLVVWLLPPLAQVRGVAGYAPLHTLLETMATAIAPRVSPTL